MLQLPQTFVIKQERGRQLKHGLLRRFAPRNDGPWRIPIPSHALRMSKDQGESVELHRRQGSGLQQNEQNRELGLHPLSETGLIRS
jgi:hypothetical protein